MVIKDFLGTSENFLNLNMIATLSLSSMNEYFPHSVTAEKFVSYWGRKFNRGKRWAQKCGKLPQVTCKHLSN